MQLQIVSNFGRITFQHLNMPPKVDIKAVIEEVLSSEAFKKTICDQTKAAISSALLESTNDMKNYFDSKLSTVNKKISELTNKVNSNEDSLQERCLQLQKQVNDTKASIEAQEMYTRRNNVCIYGIPESEREPQDELNQIILQFFREDLELHIESSCIDRCHRLGKKNDGKIRPIIVKLVRHNDKIQVLRARKKLKSTSKIGIKEDLTATRLQWLKNVRSLSFVSKSWTQDGTIVVLVGNEKIYIRSSKDIDELKDKHF